MLGTAQPTENSKTQADIKLVWHICQHWRANFTLWSWKLVSAKSCFYNYYVVYHFYVCFCFWFFCRLCGTQNWGTNFTYDHENDFRQTPFFIIIIFRGDVKKRHFDYTTYANIEGRISLYDRNYVHRLLFFITAFLAGEYLHVL